MRQGPTTITIKRRFSFLLLCSASVIVGCHLFKTRESAPFSRYGTPVSDAAVVLLAGVDNGTGVRVGDHTILTVNHVIGVTNPGFLNTFFNFGRATQVAIRGGELQSLSTDHREEIALLNVSG